MANHPQRKSSSSKRLRAARPSTSVKPRANGNGKRSSIRWVYALADGNAKMGIGQADTPDVTITQDYPTAVAIAKGELNAQNAFMTGKLKVTGNMAKLMQHQGAFAGLEGALKPLQETTEY